MTHSMIALVAMGGGIAAFLLMIAMITAGARHRRSGDGDGGGTASWMFTDNGTHHEGGHHSGGHHGGHDGGGHSGGHAGH